MVIKYESIYNRFLQKISDVEFFNKTKDGAYEAMCGWLHSTASGAYFINLFSEFSLNDDIMELRFVLERPSSIESADEEFLIELLANGMVVEWLTPKVQSTTNVLQMFAGKEQKMYSQSQHMSEIRAMLEDCELRFNKMITSRGFIKNAYVDGEI